MPLSVTLLSNNKLNIFSFSQFRSCYKIKTKIFVVSFTSFFFFSFLLNQKDNGINSIQQKLYILKSSQKFAKDKSKTD